MDMLIPFSQSWIWCFDFLKSNGAGIPESFAKETMFFLPDDLDAVKNALEQTEEVWQQLSLTPAYKLRFYPSKSRYLEGLRSLAA